MVTASTFAVKALKPAPLAHFVEHIAADFDVVINSLVGALIAKP